MESENSGYCSKRKQKKYAPVAARVGIMIGSIIIFNNFIDIPHVLYQGLNQM